MNKQEYVDASLLFLEGKISGLQAALKDAQDSANSETKSSAGDKHETSRAMAQLENERLSKQLSILTQQAEVLQKINPELISEKIGLGTVVECEHNVFFISTGLGKIKLNDSTFFAIASNSPVGKKLTGKTVGDNIQVGSNNETIIKII